MEITWVFKERKRGQVEREGVGRDKGLRVREIKKKKRLLPPADTQALWDFSLGLQRREEWNSALPEPKFEFSAKRR